MKIKMKDITYGLIKRLYRKPTKYSDNVEDGEYCVGGALLMTLAGDGSPEKFDGDVRFPGDGETIGMGIRKLNHGICREDADMFGERIISQNDDSHFARAWGSLKKALSYKSKHDHDEDGYCED